MTTFVAMERKIDLEYKREYFEEIYFKDNNSSYWKSPSLGRSPKLLLVFSLFLIALLCYVHLISKEEPTSMQNGMILVVFIGFLLSASSYSKKVAIIRQWKKSIAIYLADLDQYQQFQLILTTDQLIFEKGSEKVEINWDELQHIELTDEFILVKGTESVFLPRKTMSSSDFNFTTDFLKKKQKLLAKN